MPLVRSFHRSFSVLFFLFLFCAISSAAFAQGRKLLANAQPRERQAGMMPLPNGIDVQARGLRMKVVALRDDVLRITYTRGGSFPEDASWAVLLSTRQSSVPVSIEKDMDRFGFRTKALIVEIDKETLQLTVRDLAGNMLEQDARPLRFDGDAFRICKTMPLDEHYFGLGDKTGPLDRRNQAFSLWNTDAYRFQESTDPIYKSIPYFMAFRAGRALGVLLDNTAAATSFGFLVRVTWSLFLWRRRGPGRLLPVLRALAKAGWSKRTYGRTWECPAATTLGFGFQQAVRDSYMTQARVLEIANRLRADSIPADAIYLDIDYQDRNRPFTVNRITFPDLAGMVAQLKTENFHVVAITDLHIKL